MTNRNTETSTTLHAEVTITPASGGFGEWDCGEVTDWYEPDLLMDEITEAHPGAEILDLSDGPHDGVEDIRGRIHREPPHVYAIRYADPHPGEGVTYFGVVEMDVGTADARGVG